MEKLVVGRTDRKTEERTEGWKNRTGKMCSPYTALIHHTEGLITTLFLSWLFIFAIINYKFPNSLKYFTNEETDNNI
jgi:hypothetical protein